MKPKPRSKAHPIEREIERALHPGAFIRDGECFSFVSELEKVAVTVDQMITPPKTRNTTLSQNCKLLKGKDESLAMASELTAMRGWSGP